MTLDRQPATTRRQSCISRHHIHFLPSGCRPWKSVTSLKQRFEIRENLRPAVRYAFEHFWVALEVFMRDRQSNEPVAVRLDIEGHTRMFRLVCGVRGPRPC